jgi:hypothetical protein
MYTWRHLQQYSGKDKVHFLISMLLLQWFSSCKTYLVWIEEGEHLGKCQMSSEPGLVKSYRFLLQEQLTPFPIFCLVLSSFRMRNYWTA